MKAVRSDPHGLYGMARPFSPASFMMPVLEKGKERTDVYFDPWC
jgi:hypothetical protein